MIDSPKAATCLVNLVHLSCADQKRAKAQQLEKELKDAENIVRGW